MDVLNLGRTPVAENTQRLRREERILLRNAQEGDVNGLRQLFQDRPDLNVNVVGPSGETALDIAVDLHDESLLEALLSFGGFGLPQIYGALLRAATENEFHLFVDLLDAFELKLAQMYPESIAGQWEMSGFRTTPLIVTSLSGNADMTQLLLDRGYVIQSPHHPKCQCGRSKCATRQEKGESLFEALVRIEAYRGLCSPTYILLTSEDPILTAFQLSSELACMAKEFTEHRKYYLELSEQCSHFSAEILDQCRDSGEVETILVQRKGFRDPRPRRFSRLRLAVSCQQKQFVAHPSCQKVLESMWVRGLPSWWRWSSHQRLAHTILQAILTPVICIWCVLSPRPDECIGKAVQVPLNRFVHSATTYLCFLALLFSTVLSGEKRDSLSKDQKVIQVAIGVWVVGYAWELAVDAYLLGCKSFVNAWWPVYDLVLFSALLSAEVIWFFVITCDIMQFKESKSRSDWVWYHPFLIAEGIFSAATVMAFARVLLWYQMHSRLGPLGTSLRYMLGDVFRFLLIVFVFLFAFSIGINSIYMNYEGNKQYLMDNGEVKKQPENFVSLKNTLKTLFWGSLGMGDINAADIVVAGNSTSSDNLTHNFTEFLGYVLWGSYYVVAVVVLLNMLVAMLTDSYQRVLGNSDNEWKFARSALQMSFLDRNNLVPPPFNLLPNVHVFVGCVRAVLNCCRGKDQFLDICKATLCSLETDEDREFHKTSFKQYQILRKHLVGRYLQSIQEKCRRTDGVSANALRTVKADILAEVRKSVQVPT